MHANGNHHGRGGSRGVAIGFLIWSLLVPAWAVASEQSAIDGQHPLVWAVALEQDAWKALPDEKLILAARWLEAWQHLAGPDGPLPGEPAKYKAAMRKAKQMLDLARTRQPRNELLYWKAAALNYWIGELMPDDAKEARGKLYDEMVALTEACLAFNPNSAECLHLYATGLGRQATTRGLLASMRSARPVEGSWLRALELGSDYVSVNGDPFTNTIRLGLTQFYRLVPDWLLVRVVLGTRGDKQKAVQYAREMVAVQPYRLEMQKELGVALVCLGMENRRRSAELEEGKAILRRVVAGDFDKQDIRATDEIDKRHSAELLERPEMACAYSRDGYQEIDEAEARRAAGR